MEMVFGLSKMFGGGDKSQQLAIPDLRTPIYLNETNWDGLVAVVDKLEEGKEKAGLSDFLKKYATAPHGFSGVGGTGVIPANLCGKSKAGLLFQSLQDQQNEKQPVPGERSLIDPCCMALCWQGSDDKITLVCRPGLQLIVPVINPKGQEGLMMVYEEDGRSKFTAFGAVAEARFKGVSFQSDAVLRPSFQHYKDEILGQCGCRRPDSKISGADAAGLAF
jgi:hypothetical protein